MPAVRASRPVVPRLVERPGKVSLFFAGQDERTSLRWENLEVGLPFRSPPRAALADLSKLQPILGNLLGVELHVPAAALDGWLARATGPLVEDVTCEITPRGLLLWGRLREAVGAPAFSCRPVPRLAEVGLPVELTELRVYGIPPRSLPQLTREIAQALAGALVVGVEADGPLVQLDPLLPLLCLALGREGWKLPLRANVRLTSLEYGFGRLTLTFGRPGAGAAPSLPAPRELPPRLRQAERALLGGELDRAVPLLLAELREKSHAVWCTDRLAEALAVAPELFAQPERVLESFFRARPEYPAGLLAAAALALRGQEAGAAAERFEALARQPGQLPRERVLALTAAGTACAAGDPQRAAAYFEEALRLRRDHHAALAGLAALPSGGKPGLAAARTRQLLALEDDPAQAAALHVALGQLLLAARSDTEEARRHFERALGLQPARLEAVLGLASALVASGSGERGLALLAYLVERLFADGLVDEGVSLLLRRAAFAAALPGHEEVARESYRRVLTFEPDNEEARDALSTLDLPAIPAPPGKRDDRASRTAKEGLVTQVIRLSLEMDDQQEEEAPRIRGQIESALSAVADWPGFLENLRERARTVEDPDLKIRILLQGGEICEHRLDDPFQAEDWFDQVLQLDPEQPQALDALIRLLGRREVWPRLVELLLKRAGRAQDTDGWAELLLRSADVLARRLGEPARAVPVLEAILDALPGHREARFALAGTLEALGREEDALAQLELLEEGAERNALLQILERKARLLLGPLKRTKEGIQQLVNILKIDQNHEGALASLDELYQERGNPKMELAVVERRLANLYQKGAGSDEERALRSNLFLRRAKLRLSLRGAEETDGVRRDLEMAVKEWRENADAAEELAALYRREGNPAGLRRILPLLIELMLAGPARDALIAELEGLPAATPPPSP